MKNRLIILLVLLFIGLAPAKDNIQLFDRIVMVVNGYPVLQSELELAMQWFGTTDKKQAAQKLIDQILVAQAAEKYGVRVSSDEINQAILRMAKANGINSIEEFKKKLESQNISFSEFKDLVKRELLVQRYIQIYLRRSMFGGIKEGKEEKLRKIRIIFLSSQKPDFKEKYNLIKEKLTPENFAEMAKKYSDDPLTAEKGGLLGEVKKGDLVSSLDERIWQHKVGDIFEVPDKKGIYFVYIEKEENKMVQQPPKGEEIQKQLKKEFEIQLKKLRQQASIEYLDKSLQ
ncbi:peptidylprolyl isomerase [Persephonella sp. KM09-Lau-8]|uniref:peptidylprolyl isomerase n=1 Tax=Persephonella sp. KM09-Lau-8 TaxID=1158345 RepID=UPI00049572F3|nr:peptidylprolyl isomerase [Persephonella sp. KM09-Lau-8]